MGAPSSVCPCVEQAPGAPKRAARGPGGARGGAVCGCAGQWRVARGGRGLQSLFKSPSTPTSGEKSRGKSTMPRGPAAGAPPPPERVWGHPRGASRGASQQGRSGALQPRRAGRGGGGSAAAGAAACCRLRPGGQGRFGGFQLIQSRSLHPVQPSGAGAGAPERRPQAGRARARRPHAPPTVLGAAVRWPRLGMQPFWISRQRRLFCFPCCPASAHRVRAQPWQWAVAAATAQPRSRCPGPHRAPGPAARRASMYVNAKVSGGRPERKAQTARGHSRLWVRPLVAGAARRNVGWEAAATTTAAAAAAAERAQAAVAATAASMAAAAVEARQRPDWGQRAAGVEAAPPTTPSAAAAAAVVGAAGAVRAGR